MTVAHSARPQKRTGVYLESDWMEGAFGTFWIVVDGVRHGYDLDPTVPSRHIHGRDGHSQDYGRHVHDRWNEPHRHLHPGDKAPSEARQDVGTPRERPERQRHHAHRIYVNEAVTIGEAIDALAIAVRLGSAAYEDGRWADGHQRFIAAQDAAAAAVMASGKMIKAFADLMHDGGPTDRPGIEFEDQVRTGSFIEERRRKQPAEQQAA